MLRWKIIAKERIALEIENHKNAPTKEEVPREIARSRCAKIIGDFMKRFFLFANCNINVDRSGVHPDNTGISLFKKHNE